MRGEKLELAPGAGTVFRDLGRENADIEQLKALLWRPESSGVWYEGMRRAWWLLLCCLPSFGQVVYQELVMPLNAAKGTIWGTRVDKENRAWMFVGGNKQPPA